MGAGRDPSRGNAGLKEGGLQRGLRLLLRVVAVGEDEGDAAFLCVLTW